MKYSVIKGLYNKSGHWLTETVASNLEEYEADYILDSLQEQNESNTILYWKGRLALLKVNGEYQTVREDEAIDKRNHLEPVYKNGDILRTQSLAEIRELAKL